MAASLRLNEMSLEEKLQLMELLWDELCRKPEQVPVPAWHVEVLRERQAAVARGEEVAEDLEAVERSIRQELQ